MGQYSRGGVRGQAMAKSMTYFEKLKRDLESPIEVRRFGTGWFSGFFAILMAVAGLGLVVALRWPDLFSFPQIAVIREWSGFRPLIHIVLLGSYALALLSLLLRPRKVLGFTALGIGISAALLGGATVQPREAETFGIFFGLDFFIVNLIVTGLMFAPIERIFPHRAEQRLFRTEWREDLFYFLVSSMMVQASTFIAMAPSTVINAQTSNWEAFRSTVAGLPWLVQLLLVFFLTDFVQYWFHRTFHKFPFLWGFHVVHHSTKAMDWLAGGRMHFFEIVALRGLTSLPLLTFGFSPSVMQAYVAFVYIYSSVLHANIRGDFNRLGHWIATPRFHWHHGLEREAFDVNFAIHFPIIDKMFGTFHLPEGRWPKDYGVPENVPKGYGAQFAYPFMRKAKPSDG
jgi:sterol desaturase/sphingolipid hydroxylase (fatty acid hydroxylase superfamily)